MFLFFFLLKLNKTKNGIFRQPRLHIKSQSFQIIFIPATRLLAKLHSHFYLPPRQSHKLIMEATKSATQILSIAQKRDGFHEKYLLACKSKNLMPLPEIKSKQRNILTLDFHADRVRACDWMCIFSALFADRTLTDVAIRLRKNNESGELGRFQPFPAFSFPFIQFSNQLTRSRRPRLSPRSHRFTRNSSSTS